MAIEMTDTGAGESSTDGPRRGLGFALGVATGWVAGPLFELVSFVRQARTFHPRGPTMHAVVTRDDAAPVELHPLAERLLGTALVRFSGALFKHAEGVPDVLGCALRFRRSDYDTAEPAEDDQDLLFATIRRPWTMPFSPLTTHVRDYLDNDYFAVSPFDAGLARRVYFRLHPSHRSGDTSGPRGDRLEHEVELGEAALSLEVSDGPFGPWAPLVVVSLDRRADIDGEALRFQPFRAGRGLRPQGFVHALRDGVYSLSQRGRPAHS
jgi:hypothetical protein